MLRDLRDLTGREATKIIQRLRKDSIAALRMAQHLILAQIERTDCTPENEIVISNLQTLDAFIIVAISLKEFKE